MENWKISEKILKVLKSRISGNPGTGKVACLILPELSTFPVFINCYSLKFIIILPGEISKRSKVFSKRNKLKLSIRDFGNIFCLVGHLLF